MCGIAGMAGGIAKSVLEEMLSRIHHRGPDDSGTFVDWGGSDHECVAMGNTRLSIIDLSPAGHQPMCNEDRTVWVAYNGEIFNFQELKAELVSDGHRFQSHSDTEVLVHLYEKLGAGMVRRLNGMFAFALWDTRLKKLFLCRDRMGIKPLYYAQIGERLYFGSEIKSILASPEIATDMDYESLYRYMALLYVPAPGTMFRGIKKLLPGHMLIWSRGQTQIEPYWQMNPGNYFTSSEDELAVELKATLMSATRAQLVSDVPVGFFLSGGVDSSTLVACAAAAGGKDLNCFSIAYSDQHGRLEQSTEDARYARMVAHHFGAKFHEIKVAPDVASLLPKTVYHLDDPVADHAAIATYLICKSAKSEVKVLLSGQGGDEVFAGYRVHLTSHVTRYLGLLPGPARRLLAAHGLPFIAAHRELVPFMPPGLLLAACRYMERMLGLTGMDQYRQYANARAYLSEPELDSLFLPAVRAQITQGFETVFLNHFRGQAQNPDQFVNEMLEVDCKTFLPDLNLAYSDKLSMAASIEVRVPFLDNNVVDFMMRVPPRLKMNGFKQKYLLKKAVAGLLPRSVLNRRKAGFGLPVRSWLRNELHTMVGDILSEDRVRSRGLFKPEMIQRMIQANHSGTRDYTLSIWALLTLELWQQEFCDARPIPHVVPLAVPS